SSIRWRENGMARSYPAGDSGGTRSMAIGQVQIRALVQCGCCPFSVPDPTGVDHRAWMRCSLLCRKAGCCLLLAEPIAGRSPDGDEGKPEHSGENIKPRS